jgi:hypothetical protein
MLNNSAAFSPLHAAIVLEKLQLQNITMLRLLLLLLLIHILFEYESLHAQEHFERQFHACANYSLFI